MKTIYSNLLIVLLAFSLSSCRTTKSKFIFEKVLWAADWSPNDLWIAVGGNNNALKLLSSDALSLQKSFKKPNTITKIKWHSEDQLLALTRQVNDQSGSDDSRVEIINIEDGTVIPLDLMQARALNWNPAGDKLAVGDYEGRLSIFSKEGVLLNQIQTDQKSIIGLSWHPNEERIVTVGSHIEIINIDNGERVSITPREIEILMLCVEWHPSGEFFVTGDYGDFIQDYSPLLIFWDKDGRKIREIEKSKAEYRNLKWTRQGDLLATASDKVRTWTKEGDLIKERNMGSLLWGIDWNDKDEKIVVSSEDGKVFILNRDLKKLTSLE